MQAQRYGRGVGTDNIADDIDHRPHSVSKLRSRKLALFSAQNVEGGQGQRTGGHGTGLGDDRAAGLRLSRAAAVD